MDYGITSLSAEEAGWWKKASPATRKAYIEAHPKSKYAQGVRAGTLSLDNSSKAKRKEIQLPKAERKQSKPALPAKPEVKEPVKLSRRARAKQAITDRAIDERVFQNKYVVKQDIQENYSKFRRSIPRIKDVVANKFSPQGNKNFLSFTKTFAQGKFKAKGAPKEEMEGAKLATQVLKSITENIVGQKGLSKTSNRLVDTVLGAFLGPTNYKEIKRYMDGNRLSSVSAARKSTSVNDYKTELDLFLDSLASKRFVSLSNEDAIDEIVDEVSEEEEPEDEDEDYEPPEVKDTLETFINLFSDWFKDLDLEALSIKIAKIQAIQELIEEGFLPTEEELEKEMEEEPEEEQVPLELDTIDGLESDSAVTPRISFRVCPKQKRLDSKERTRFDVMFDNRIIGCIESDPEIEGNGKSRRSWKAKLYEGFSESSFHTGRQDTKPYTIVKSNRVVLFNPIRQTYDECKLWIKHNLNKDYL